MPVAPATRPKRKSPTNWSITTKIRVIEMYKAGWTAGEIQRITQVPVGTTYSWLRKEGVPRRDQRKTQIGKSRTDARKIELLRRLYVEREMSAEQIGDMLGCHHTTVRYHLRHNGVVMRDKREQNLLAYKHGRKLPPSIIAYQNRLAAA